MEELRQKAEELLKRIDLLRGIFDVETLTRKIAELEKQIEKPDLWNDPQNAQKITKEHANLKKEIESLNSLQREASEFTDWFDLAEDDQSLIPEIKASLKKLEKKIAAVELEKILGGEMDNHNAIVTIHPGAGGTESQDWAQMLFRLYLRWAERRRFKTQVIDLLPGDEAGIKSVDFTVQGDYAYGYLKSETGVHRLVRISPFDANHRRHTSFASVFVTPEVDDDVEIEIDEKDLRIDTYRSSGAGGQHVNVTDSAVRITHIPTGIVAQCQNERSQHRNKDVAMKMLRSRLYEKYAREKEEELKKTQGDKKEIAWGSQIRSYVLAPYRLVKDHRTDFESGNVDAILDGDIDPFIEAFLSTKMTR
ncbi:peptide chain release factor 2 [bacterium]|nr:peptide chain release factor 2 [bacterium]